MTVNCPLCESQFATVSIFMTHLKLIHSNEPNFCIRCNLEGCQRTFKNFYTYRNHVYSMHSQLQSTDPLCEDLETTSNHAQDSDIPETDLAATLETENDFERNSLILEAANDINQSSTSILFLDIII